jgi:hypothetical protein
MWAVAVWVRGCVAAGVGGDEGINGTSTGNKGTGAEWIDNIYWRLAAEGPYRTALQYDNLYDTKIK